MKNTKFKAKVIGIILLTVMFASSDLIAQRMQRNLNNQGYDGTRLHQNGVQGRFNNNNLGQRRMLNQDFDQRGGMFGLDLTEEQIGKMKELRTSNLKEMLPFKNEMQEKRARLRTLTTAENVNEKEVNKTIDEITSLTSKQMKLREAHQQEIRAMLTDEQRVIFDTSKNRMGKGQFARGGNRRGGGRNMGSGPGFRAR
jgi:Spy/CpxP family protein refolding chaperone